MKGKFVKLVFSSVGIILGFFVTTDCSYSAQVAGTIFGGIALFTFHETFFSNIDSCTMYLRLPKYSALLDMLCETIKENGEVKSTCFLTPSNFMDSNYSSYRNKQVELHSTGVSLARILCVSKFNILFNSKWKGEKVRDFINWNKIVKLKRITPRDFRKRKKQYEYVDLDDFIIGEFFVLGTYFTLLSKITSIYRVKLVFENVAIEQYKDFFSKIHMNNPNSINNLHDLNSQYKNL